MVEDPFNSETNSSPTLAQPDARLGAHFLNLLYSSVTILFSALIYWVLLDFFSSRDFILFVVPLIPFLFLINYTIDAWDEGTTLGHKSLGLYIVDEKTGEAFTLSRMVMREFVIKGLVCGLISIFSLYIFFIVDSLMVTRDDRKTFHDRMVGSIVVKR